MAGTVVVTRKQFKDEDQRIEKISLAITADAAAATVPNTLIPMFGELVKAVVNPGATGPTDNYDMTLGDPLDVAFDALGGALNNRDIATTEQVYPLVNTRPVVLAGEYTFGLANNAVNSATVAVDFYLKKNL